MKVGSGDVDSDNLGLQLKLSYSTYIKLCNFTGECR